MPCATPCTSALLDDFCASLLQEGAALDLLAAMNDLVENQPTSLRMLLIEIGIAQRKLTDRADRIAAVE